MDSKTTGGALEGKKRPREVETDTSSETIAVAIRSRPLNAKELLLNEKNAWQIENGQIISQIGNPVNTFIFGIAAFRFFCLLPLSLFSLPFFQFDLLLSACFL